MIDRHVARGAEEIRAHAAVHLPPRALRPNPQKHFAHELLGDGARAHEAIRVAAEDFIVRAEQRPKSGRAAVANSRDDLAIIVSGGPLAANRFEGRRHPTSRVASAATQYRRPHCSSKARRTRRNRARYTVYDDV